jgi:uncharacterized protein with NRDE domain
MCTLLLAWQVDPGYPLILAANRDEFYQRPTAPAGYWRDASQVFAGRDLVHGGSWLGVTTGGRLAALTNYREPHEARRDAPSRGELVSGFLRQDLAAGGYLERLRPKASSYSGFNLLLGDLEGLYHYSNKTDRVLPIPRGIHGVSNHLLDTPWPKVVRGKEALARVVGAGNFAVEDIFDILADRTPAPDERLPDTGIGLERERLLSSIFIASESYGTRCSTVLLVDRERQATFIERTFESGVARDETACFDWSSR